ncbi:MAG: protein kinase, partial [Thermoguttaceae bacterium]|nr:protein kinase [Thermoguttaceae bacterium]
MSLSLDDLNQRLLSLDLLDLDKIRAVETSFGSKLFTADEFLRTAQRYGYLTKYQVERLMAGETTGFYYGDYRIQYLIGAGSFARVFRCVHRESGKVFAVKVLRARFRDDQTAIQEFIREGEMGMELRHPNIAAVYEAQATKYDHYMVMEFIEGNTLREMLAAQKNGYLDPKRATRMAYDICSALEYAQKRGYQHRDMKPSNIMIASSGRAVLLDFGLLTDASSSFKTQRAIEYAALERATHVRRDDPRSDLYFLGAVYYQALTGVAPLGEIKERSRRLDASRFRNVKMIHEVSKTIPRCVATVVDRSLKFRPEERYQNPEMFKNDLERVIAQLERGEGDEVLTAAQPKEEYKKPQKTIMIVEGNTGLQETFREFFKNAGFRPLVVSNAPFALQRLEDVEVDAVLFNAQTLGQSAVAAFNQLLDSPLTKDLPAVLLLNEDQVKWGAHAKRTKKRLAVGMPISMKRLLMVVDKLTREEFAER